MTTLCWHLSDCVEAEPLWFKCFKRCLFERSEANIRFQSSLWYLNPAKYTVTSDIWNTAPLSTKAPFDKGFLINTLQMLYGSILQLLITGTFGLPVNTFYALFMFPFCSTRWWTSCCTCLWMTDQFIQWHDHLLPINLFTCWMLPCFSEHGMAEHVVFLRNA